jgi:hypothetical protein
MSRVTTSLLLEQDNLVTEVGKMKLFLRPIVIFLENISSSDNSWTVKIRKSRKIENAIKGIHAKSIKEPS